jgi:hypothetical protein
LNLKFPWFIFYLILIANLVCFIEKFGINIPYWDQWSLVDLYEKTFIGKSSFSDFFSLNNEHRVLFPKLIFVTLAYLSNWNIKVELYFNLALSLIMFIALYRISCLCHNHRNFIFYASNLLVCVFIFSIGQYENWLWGFQIAWFLVNTCIILVILCLTSAQEDLSIMRLILMILCCLIASFSSLHGLLSWIVVVPITLLRRSQLKQRLFNTGLLFLGFLLSTIFYFANYQKSGSHPDIFFFRKNLMTTIEYFFNIIGSPIVRFSSAVGLSPSVIGIFIVLLFLIFNCYCVKQYLQNSPIYQFLPWISLGWFSILFAGATAIGRSGFGVEQALSSRYVSVSVLLVIACINLWSLIVLNQQQRNFWQYRLLTTAFILGVLSTIYLYGLSSDFRMAKESSAARLTGKTCLELISYLDDSLQNSCLSLLYPDSHSVVRWSASLETLGFLQKVKTVEFIPHTSTSPPIGHIDFPTGSQIFKSGEQVAFRGWGVDREHSSKPQVVFLSLSDKRFFFAVAPTTIERRDVSKHFSSEQFLYSGWEVSIPAKQFSNNEQIVKAWVYDPMQHQLLQLDGEPRIRVLDNC